MRVECEKGVGRLCVLPCAKCFHDFQTYGFVRIFQRGDQHLDRTWCDDLFEDFDARKPNSRIIAGEKFLHARKTIALKRDQAHLADLVFRVSHEREGQAVDGSLPQFRCRGLLGGRLAILTASQEDQQADKPAGGTKCGKIISETLHVGDPLS